MSWTCEFCGWENLQDDRVGGKEPACVRCSLRRGSRAAAIEELQDRISSLQENDRACVAQIRHYKSVIDNLWTELHGFEDKHDEAVKEHRDNTLDLQIAEAQLRELRAVNPTARRVTEDQRTLPEVTA